MSLNLDPKEIHDKILVTGQEWAKAETRADLAEDAYKHTLHCMIQDIRSQPGASIAMNDAESRARASHRVKRAAQRRDLMKGKANQLKIQYDAAKIWFEAMRTKAATLRQEMHSLGGQR